jgi:hypothetical protein
LSGEKEKLPTTLNLKKFAVGENTNSGKNLKLSLGLMVETKSQPHA